MSPEYGSPEDVDWRLPVAVFFTLTAIVLTLIAGAMIRDNASAFRRACLTRGGVVVRIDRMHALCTINDKIVEVRP